MKITAPLKSTDLVAVVPLASPIALSAVSNATGGNSATYSWSVSSLGTVVTQLGAALAGQSVSYAHPDPGCGSDIKLRFSVVATDALGRIASDSVDAVIKHECPPL